MSLDLLVWAGFPTLKISQVCDYKQGGGWGGGEWDGAKSWVEGYTFSSRSRVHILEWPCKAE